MVGEVAGIRLEYLIAEESFLSTPQRGGKIRVSREASLGTLAVAFVGPFGWYGMAYVGNRGAMRRRGQR